MRLFRRSFLCLVVGVTAFGFAGWGFRPRANWTVELPKTFSQIVPGGHELSDNEPIWLAGASHSFIACRATDGALLQKVRTDANSGIDGSRALVDGRLAVAQGEDVDTRRSRMTYFSTTSNEPVASADVVGDWAITADWQHAWRLIRKGAGHLFECRDLSTNRLTRTVEYPTQFRIDLGDDDLVADYSPELELLAVSERMRVGRESPFGIELRDGVTGELVKTIGRNAPDNEGSGPRWLCFLLGGRYLKYELIGNSPTWVLPGVIDVKSGQETAVRRASLPITSESFSEIWVTADARGRLAWTLSCSSPSTAWVSLTSADEQVPTWRRVIGDVEVEEIRRKSLTNGRRLRGVDAHLVPQRDALVVRLTGTSLVSSIPEPLARLVPPPWKEIPRVPQHRWVDWKTGEWRNTGSSGAFLNEQLRPNMLITLLDNGEERTVLQSWPLPPRDPKWPALGVAIACAAGSWWMCAWRYRRRLKRATLAAATA